jgi:hypothetical protein
MSKLTIRIVELDGTVIDREMTDEELAQYEITVENSMLAKAEKETNAEAKSALLDRLGITEDEAKLLLS